MIHVSAIFCYTYCTHSICTVPMVRALFILLYLFKTSYNFTSYCFRIRLHQDYLLKAQKRAQAFWFHTKIFFLMHLISRCEANVTHFFFHTTGVVHSTQYTVCSTFQYNHPQRAKLCRRGKIKAHFPRVFWCGFCLQCLSFFSLC